jgi:NAD-dependent deacetylase
VCPRDPFPDERGYLGEPPPCEECRAHGRDGLLRPAVVWFGELLDPARLERVSSFIDGARGHLVFLAVGTSGLVYPAAGLVLQARAAGATAWLVNKDAPDNRRAFHHFVQGPSGEILPELFEWA